MEIRLLTSQDAEEYRKIRLEALLKHPDAFAVSYEEEIERPVVQYADRFQSKESFTLGAYKEKQLVGTVTVVKERYKKLQHRANLVAMYVQTEHRQNGVGRRLILAAIEQARLQPELEQIYLTVVKPNVAAKSLYESLGFTVYGTDRNAMKIEDTYLDEELMVFFL